MIETIITTAFESPLIISLTIGYFLSEAVSTYDTRLIQWKKTGDIPQYTKTPPEWTGLFAMATWIILVALLILNWQYGLLLWIAVFILKVIPVMDNIGRLLLTTFLDKEIGMVPKDK